MQRGVDYCICCGFPITPHEAHYYAGQCEPCIEDAHARVKRWLNGAADKELDERYSVSEKPSTFNA